MYREDDDGFLTQVSPQEEYQINMKKKEIFSAFMQAQQDFAPALKKQVNSHFRSKYADLASCIDAVIDALHKHGLALMQVPHESESGITVETLFLHKSGQVLSGGKFHVPAQKQDPQGYGSALTYARRYGLMSACGIAPEDDDGNAASAPVATPKAIAKPSPKPETNIKSEVDLYDASLAIRESEDIDVLKAIFGDAYRKATKDEQVILKKCYDTRKLELENSK